MGPQNWIFLRGLVRDSRHWGAFVAEFEQTIPEARVVMLDVPGNGVLNALTSPTTVRGMVENCRAQLQARGVAGPYRILAVSMGAMLAAEWSHAYPDDVQAQVLINTSMRPFSAFYQRLRPANYGTLFRLLWGRTSAHDWERAILRMTTNQPHEHILPAWQHFREQHPVTTANALRQLLAAARYQASRAKPKAPTLVLASEKDQLVSVSCSRALAACWGVPLAVHPTAGHDLTLDDGHWVAQQVSDWSLSGFR
ncbi:MAG TPA: alpha/beta hydrolase [Rhodoferax sp.]|jgi:pimeloyl-ACP methyl ester carboxylesterase|nr:alpha/beta hydrolase [Rhodoferax sp.]